MQWFLLFVEVGAIFRFSICRALTLAAMLFFCCRGLFCKARLRHSATVSVVWAEGATLLRKVTVIRRRYRFIV